MQKLLVIDGDTAAANEKIVAHGGREFGLGYAEVLRGLQPKLDLTIIHPADAHVHLPKGLGSVPAECGMTP